MRNKKSILGMNVVRPSANRTVISNPRVDPISVKPGQAAPAEQAKNTVRSSFQVFSPVSAEPTRHVAQDYTSRDIKLANIISQKKKDD